MVRISKEDAVINSLHFAIYLTNCQYSHCKRFRRGMLGIPCKNNGVSYAEAAFCLIQIASRSTETAPTFCLGLTAKLT